jgi:hypothetical protein
MFPPNLNTGAEKVRTRAVSVASVERSVNPALAPPTIKRRLGSAVPAMLTPVTVTVTPGPEKVWGLGGAVVVEAGPQVSWSRPVKQLKGVETTVSPVGAVHTHWQ